MTRPDSMAAGLQCGIMTSQPTSQNSDTLPILQVAVPVPLPGCFDYLALADAPVPAVGARVRVMFGRRKLVGMVMTHGRGSELPQSRIKPILEVLDSSPLIDASLLGLLQWAADYYQYPLGEVIASALPKTLRQGQLATLKPRHRGLPAPCESLGSGPALNAEQQQAVAAVSSHWGRFQGFLLEGITGSGKTEVYLHLAQAALAQGKQVLVLVPEIALTPQLVARFRERLPTPVAVMHSALSDGDRHCAWLLARSGEAGVIIGTRSAVFVPWARPGLIIVDEEHDPSLKQHEGFRYHARDLAMLRGHRESVPVLLGSATPSLESLANVQRGQYQRVRLPARAGGAELPRIELLDLRRRFLDEGLAEPLLERMQKHLQQQGQVLLFLNRRGFAPALLCHDCGWVADCRRCDARMTWHARAARLRCHHCGYECSPPPRCPACDSALAPQGEGTQRIEAALQRHFPDYPVVRIDRDSTSRKGSLEDALAEIRSGHYRILVGTQMLAKGHDFPDVTLAAVLDADQGLFSSDFRAIERLAQTIVQVAGRAGRGERRGEVMVQTHQPDHPLLRSLIAGGYARFAEVLLEERRMAQLPPYASLALLRAEATEAHWPQAFLSEAYQLLAAQGDARVQLWGPAPAPMERRAGRYRAQLLIQAEQRAPLQAVLRQCLPQLGTLETARRVRWSLDVDPADLH